MISKIKKYSKVLVASVFLFGSIFSIAVAATGTIDSTYKTAALCTNTDCSTYTRINFKPSSLTGSQIVSVTDDEITGYAWSETFGWINMSPTMSGVKNDGEGNLSGFAWGENAGWINFDPTNGGVIIDDGEFSGWAWAQNYGWIKFDCANNDSCVKTSWKPSGDSGTTIITPPSTLCTAGYVMQGDRCVLPTPTCLDGYSLQEGQCILNSADKCLNIPNIQLSVPDDYTKQGNDCFLKTIPKDVCINLDSEQLTVPPNYELKNGLCILKQETDYCQNISEIQTSVPVGYIIDGSGNCVSFCEAYPSDTACVGVVEEEDLCELNPNHPSCIVTPPSTTDDGNGLAITQDTFENFLNKLNDVLNIDLSKTIDTIKDAIKTTQGKTVSSTIALTGIVSGALMGLTTALFANPLVFSELFFIPMRIWSLILAALGVKRKNRPWGTVYDSVTKQPLDPAYVVLQDLQGNEVATSITDLDGRYGFLVQPGQYRIVANKTNYEFPSIKLSGKTSDELYHDLYFNEVIEIKEEGEVIIKNIPMDPLKFDWNEFAKKDQKLMKFYSKRDVFIARLSNFLFYFGFVITLVSVIAQPKTYNLIILGIYVLMFILRSTILRKKPFGTIKEAFNGNPLSFAVIRVFSTETDHEIIHKVSDKTGKYYCLVPNGVYYVKIQRKNEDGSYTEIHKSGNIEVKNGYIGKKFKI